MLSFTRLFLLGSAVAEKRHLRGWGGFGGLGQVGDLQAVIVVAPFAFIQDGAGDFLDREVSEHGGFAAEGAAANQQRAVFTHFFAQLGELFVGERLGGDVEVVFFG